MKRLLLLGVGSALMFTMGGVGSAQADTDATQPIHKSTKIAAGAGAQLVAPGTARCASCHRAHTAKAEYLLKQAQPGLCYSCHGGAGSYLDVVDGVDPNATAGMGTALRGGGFAYALLNGAGATMTVTATGKSSEALPLATGTPVTSRHQIDGTTSGIMWGNGAVSDAVGNQGIAVPDATTTSPAKAGDAGLYGVTLECGSCHDPHGNGNYRILKPVPSDAGTAQTIKEAAVPATPTTSFKPAVYCTVKEASGPCSGTGYKVGGLNGVNIPDAATKEYTTLDYWKVADPNVPTVLGGPLPVYGTGTIADETTTADLTDATDNNHILVGKGGTDGFITNVAQWCTTCHTRYLAGSKSWKTPLANGVMVDKTFTYRHRGDSTDKEGASRPNCIQCHVSHGSNVAMTGEAAAFTAPDGSTPGDGSGAKGRAGVGSYPDTGADVVAVGTSRLLRVDNRGTCKMCHNV